MTTGIWILGDQLWLGHAALQRYVDVRSQTPIILIESLAHVQQRPYHAQKLVLVWSAMRHFAAELQQAGWPVTYIEQAEDFAAPLINWITTNSLSELVLMEPSDRPFAAFLQTLELPCALTQLPCNRFLWSRANFAQWAKPRKRLLLEDFYREGRRHFSILMEGEHPVGGKWNFDSENRKPPKSQLKTPDPLWFEPDSVTTAVIQQVQALNFPLYGKATPFRWAVTRQQALAVLHHFIETRLPTFGPYQDAMVTGEQTLWHALISPYLNLGLLHPQEAIAAAETAFHEKGLALNSVEGFIRQVLGWREYMHGLYHMVEADYPQRNWFNHTHPLPEFYWNAQQTDMNCLHQCLQQTEQTGYAHHIQRLMVLNNFALIAGITPQAIESWFHTAFIDAYDWVMQTNVIGMGQFADGGLLASKPYAASANYINKMSDYCRACTYDHRRRTGEQACPFNVFYWDFLARHRDQLQSQGRMSLILKNLDRMDPSELATIRQQAQEWHHHQKPS